MRSVLWSLAGRAGVLNEKGLVSPNLQSCSLARTRGGLKTGAQVRWEPREGVFRVVGLRACSLSTDILTAHKLARKPRLKVGGDGGELSWTVAGGFSGCR